MRYPILYYLKQIDIINAGSPGQLSYKQSVKQAGGAIKVQLLFPVPNNIYKVKMTEQTLRTIEFYQKEQIRMMREFVDNLEEVTKQFKEVVEKIKEHDLKFD